MFCSITLLSILQVDETLIWNQLNMLTGGKLFFENRKELILSLISSTTHGSVTPKI